MRLTRVSTIALVVVVGCMPRTPYIDGMAAAPAAPNRLWRAPQTARAADSLGASPAIPSDIATRANTLTLADAVELSLRNNPATRVSWAQARATADAYAIARTTYVPTVNGVISDGRSDPPGGGETAGGLRTSYGASLSLAYLLFDFGGRSGTVASARNSAFADAYTHNRVVQTTVLQVEQGYFGYVGARALLEAQRVAVREAQASYDAARARDSAGLATIADVLQARTALAQARLQLQSTEAQLQTARGALALALGVPPTSAWDVADGPRDVCVSVIAASVDALIDVALSARPDLQAARATAAAARSDVRVARSAMLPSLALSAGDGYTHSTLGALTGRNYTVSVAVQIPLIDGGGKANGVARARALADAAAAQAAVQRQTVIYDVYTAYYDLKTAAQQVETSDELLTSATASMRAARARYTSGVGSIIDLITAQAALANAGAQQAQSRWLWAQALARLAYTSGTLDTSGRSALTVQRDVVPPSPR